MMDLDEFRADLINTINAKSIVNKEQPATIFLEDYVSEMLSCDYGIDDLQVYYFFKLSTSNKFKNMYLDGWSINSSVNNLTLVYCDYSDSALEKFNFEHVNDCISLLENFVTNVFRGFFNDIDDGSPVTDLARELIRESEDIFKISLVYVTTNLKNDRLMKRSWNLPQLECGAHKFDIDVIVLDIENLYEFEMMGEDKDKINIETKDYGLPEGIPCIKAEIGSDDYDSYLAIVPGKFLADIYLDYNTSLLESNVRSYLSNKGKINKGITLTLINEKSRFFAYNNGIATTADSITVEARHGGTYITRFENLQIINGGQTTASLAAARFKNLQPDLSGVYVQMKLTIIKNKDVAEDLIPRITKFANRQNKVTDADLDSNHAYYIKIKDFSEQIKAPQLPNTPVQTSWFFERSRGQYEQERMLLSQSERDQYERLHPKGQKITKTDIAKYISSADDLLPYEVSLGAEKNLAKFQSRIEDTWDKDKDKYNELYFKDLIAKAILYKHIDSIVLRSEWYQNDRAYKNAIVPYTLSKFVYETKKINMLPNYSRIWNEQECIKQYDTDLAEIAFLVYKEFNNKNRSISNIGEYAKKKECWDAVANTPYQLSEGTIDNLVKADRAEEKAKAAQKDQKVQNLVSTQLNIYNAGPDYWQKVLDLSSLVDGLLTYYDKELCKLAIKYSMGQISFLKDSEIKTLLKIMEKMKSYNIVAEME